MTEADKARLFFVILDRIQLSQMSATQQALPTSEHKRKGKETLIYYLKRKGFIKEIVPLFSKSWHLRALNEDRSVKDRSKLFAQSREWGRIFVDVKLIRNMYGDEVAIYFEWMQTFLQHLMWPGVFAIIVFIANQTIYTFDKSPLSAWFSVSMTFWGVYFTVNWSRH